MVCRKVVCESLGCFELTHSSLMAGFFEHSSEPSGCIKARFCRVELVNA
jgi:hypothetical protein